LLRESGSPLRIYGAVLDAFHVVKPDFDPVVHDQVELDVGIGAGEVFDLSWLRLVLPFRVCSGGQPGGTGLRPRSNLRHESHAAPQCWAL